MLKKISALAVTLIAISLTYYFLYFLPAHKKQELSLEQNKFVEQQKQALALKKEKCREVGEKAYSEYRTLNGPQSQFVYNDPKYTYGQKLDTCLYSGGYWTESMWERWIRDAYTNDEISRVSNIAIDGKFLGGDTKTKQIEDFDKLSEEIFKSN